MGDGAARREYFKVHFVVDGIATAFTNKCGGAGIRFVIVALRARKERSALSSRRGRRSTWETSHAKIFTVEWRPADSIYRMIKHLTWISARREARREARVKPTEAERPGIFLLETFSPLLPRLLFLFYLGNRPASPYKLPFVPLISPRPLARTYLIRINARAAWKLASRSVRARLSFPIPVLLSRLAPSSVSYVTTGNNPAVQGAKTRIVRAYTNQLRRRKREEGAR